MEASPADEAAIVTMTDATRRSHAEVRLRRDDHIGDAAPRWSVRMANTGAFVHSKLGWSRARRTGAPSSVGSPLRWTAWSG